MRKTVIYFKSKRALEHLLKHGEVYTIRPKERTEGFAVVKTSRKSQRLAVVDVKYVGKVSAGTLDNFVDKSGFRSVREWLEEVRRLNGGKLPERMFLYCVKLLERL